MIFLYKILAKQIPGLGLKLKEARMDISEEAYVKKVFKGALMLSIVLSVAAFMIISEWWMIFSFPLLFMMLLSYFMRLADVKIEKSKREVDKEILFAGRFLIIELESGVPLYNAFRNLADNYETIGPYFDEIVGKIDLGTSMDDAINEVIIASPSPNLRKILWQVLNSFKTGSDIMNSLNVVLDQIEREQEITIKEYGRKLNPIAMFYMMAAIIIPSLGITMMAVLASFIGWEISLPVLLFIVLMLGFVQFMFLAVIKSSRPPMSV